jgi:hypothetical protein
LFVVQHYYERVDNDGRQEKESYVMFERGMNMRCFCTVLIFLIMSSLIAGDATDATMEILKLRVATLEAERDDLRAKSVTFKTLAALEVDLRMYSLDDNGKGNKIPGKLVLLLGINDAERAALIKAISETREVIDEQIKKQKPSTETIPGGYKLIINKFIAEGKICEGNLMKEIEAVLGADRSRIFQRNIRSLRETWFMNFGESTNTYTMLGSGKNWSCRSESKSENGSSSGTSSLESIGRISFLTPYLPPEILKVLKGDKPEADDVKDF